MTTKAYLDLVRQYYDRNQFLYTWLWSENALHFGLWGEQTRTLDEAVTNTNRHVADHLNIMPGDVVLDAGCGVGGTAIYLARSYGVTVSGITLSHTQIKVAERRSDAARTSSLTSFTAQDFVRTTFADGAFTKAFCIESACHAECKLDLFRELHRLVAPGGRLVIVDAFVNKPASEMSSRERHAYEKFLYGWALPNLSSVESCRDDLTAAGFMSVTYYDATVLVKKSSLRIFVRSLLAYPVTWMLSGAGLIPDVIHRNTIACYNQKKLVDLDTCCYGTFVAEKPL